MPCLIKTEIFAIAQCDAEIDEVYIASLYFVDFPYKSHPDLAHASRLGAPLARAARAPRKSSSKLHGRQGGLETDQCNCAAGCGGPKLDVLSTRAEPPQNLSHFFSRAKILTVRDVRQLRF